MADQHRGLSNAFSASASASSAAAAAAERGPQQQVFRRIAGQREFRRDHQLRTIVVRGAGGRDDSRDVAGEVADGDVDLGKSESGSWRDRRSPAARPNG